MNRRLITILAFLVCFFQVTAQKAWTSKYVQVASDGSLAYTKDEQGNTIPDFSGVGYKKNRTSIPKATVIMTLEPGNDDLKNIQKAIDEIAVLPLDNKGLRGALLLKKGKYLINGTIRIRASGIVLRGEGPETILVATSPKQHNLISVSGSGEIKEINGSRRKIQSDYVPVGALSFQVSNIDGLNIGDSIILYRPGTDEWIHAIGMDQIEKRDSATKQWKSSEYDLHYERVITDIKDNTIYIDNPVVMAIENQFGGGEIYKYTFQGRLQQVGIEDLVCESVYKSNEDENHGWNAIHMNKLVNGWVTNIISRYFGYACVNLGYQARNITVANCQFLEPKSIITGSRRYSFNNDGQLNLFMNCAASEGRHDYITGAKVCGPNVFYACTSINAKADIGPHHRWATGTLFDNIISDGELNIQDRGNWGTGHGWAGANQVVWNCTVKSASIQQPPVSAKNYAIGLKGKKTEGRLKDRPDGVWEGNNIAGLTPHSLYIAQLVAAKNREQK